jgi:hypothetical protein
MNKLLIALALATVFACPAAFAQSYDPSVGSGNLNAAPYPADLTIQSGTPFDARAHNRQVEPANGLRAQAEKRHRSGGGGW